MHEKLFKELRNTPLIQYRQMISITVLSFKKRNLSPSLPNYSMTLVLKKYQLLPLQSKVDASSNIESEIARFGPLTANSNSSIVKTSMMILLLSKWFSNLEANPRHFRMNI